MIKTLKLSSLLLAIGFLSGVYGQAIKFGTPTYTGAIDGDATAKAQIQAQLNTIQADINKDLPSVDAKAYATGMANAGVMTTKGLGVDYASDISIFSLGVGLGAGIVTGDGGFSNLATAAGVGAQVSVAAGINLGLFPMPTIGPVDLSKITLFVNFFSMDLPNFDDSLKGSFTSFGIHARYRAIDGMDLGLGTFKWNGVDLTTGFDAASFDLTVTQSLKQSGSSAFTGGTFNYTYNSTATFGPKISVVTIPIEISTGVRLLYIFNLYAGLGMDLNFGSAEVVAAAPGNLTGTTTGVSGTVTVPTTVNLGGSASPDFLGIRPFGGLQINLGPVKLFAQGNYGIIGGAVGVNGGVRLAW